MWNLQEKANLKKWIILCLIMVIIVQCAICIYFGTKKNGFFEDEMMTYELANNPDGFISWGDGFLDSWHSGSYYHDVLSLDESERFDFSIPYVNQERDVHPFLYYFAVHLVCSFFPEMNFTWLGIFLNLCFCVITSVFLFKLAEAIIKNNVMALVCVIAWAWSVGAAGTAVFLRMYAMLGMWCVIFALLLTRMLQNAYHGNSVRVRCWIGLFIVTVASILTQYYFLVFCFFACAIALIYLLVKKAWRKSLAFVIAELGGCVLSYICFPAMRRHIFSGYRGRQAFSNFTDSTNYLNHLKTVVGEINDELFNGWLFQILIIYAIIIVIYLIIRIGTSKRYVENEKLVASDLFGSTKPIRTILNPCKGGMVVIWGAVCLCYVFVISRIAPHQVDRYYFCIYPIIALVAISLFFALERCIIKKRNVVYILSIVVVLFITGMSYIQQSVPYLYTEYEQRTEVLAEYSDFPVIVVNMNYDNYMDKWLYEFEQFPAVYRCHANSFEGLANAVATQDLSEGFLVYEINSGLSDEEFIAELSKYIPISDWKILTDQNTKVYFCIPST